MAKSELPFDQVIKDKLSAFVHQDPPDWNFMQHKLNDAESDLDFDQKIKQTFEDLKVDSPQIGWDSFVAKRNRQIARTNKIITARVIESCLILLLLWTIENIGITSLIKPDILKPLKSGPLAELFSKDYFTVVASSSEPDNQNAITQNDNPITDNSDIPNHSGFNAKKINASGKFEKSIVHKKLVKPPYINPIQKDHEDNILNSDGISNTNEQLIQDNTQSVISKSGQANVELIPSSADELNKQEEILSPLKKEIPQLQKSIHKPDDDKLIKTQTSLIRPMILNKALLLNIHAGMMVNAIYSPGYFDPEKTYTQVRPGFQTSLSIGFQSKKYMLESGLSYQNFSYEPNIADKIYLKNGLLKISFNKINMQVLTIPVLIHFNLLQGSQWSLSAKTGLALSAILKNKFELDSTYYYCEKDYNSISWAPNPYSEISNRAGNPSNKGLLDGGNFGVNSYTNFIAGIRYTHKLHSKISFYTEIEFSKMLGMIGVGPNADRYLSTNLNTGISLKL